MSETWALDQQAAQARLEAAQMMAEPFTIYRPRIFIEGNQWCALYGENLQDGVAGFGDSPRLAAIDFNANWDKTL